MTHFFFREPRQLLPRAPALIGELVRPRGFMGFRRFSLSLCRSPPRPLHVCVRHALIHMHAPPIPPQPTHIHTSVFNSALSNVRLTATPGTLPRAVSRCSPVPNFACVSNRRAQHPRFKRFELFYN